MNSGIYCIENEINGKKYIGQGSNANKRMMTRHLECKVLRDAIEKYGSENFKRYIIEYCKEEELSEKETYYIKKLHSHVSEGGYNISWGGDAPMKGRKHSLKTRKQLSKTHSGKNHPLFGKHHSEITKEKIRKANTGKHLSEKTKELLRQAGYKRKQSESAKEKVRQSKLGKPRTEELKKKVSFTKLKQANKRKNSTSIYHNVRFVKRGNCIRWRSSIKIFGEKGKEIGSFLTEINAAISVDKFIMNNNLPNILNFPKWVHILNIKFIFIIFDFMNRKIKE